MTFTDLFYTFCDRGYMTGVNQFLTRQVSVKMCIIIFILIEMFFLELYPKGCCLSINKNCTWRVRLRTLDFELFCADFGNKMCTKQETLLNTEVEATGIWLLRQKKCCAMSKGHSVIQASSFYGINKVRCQCKISVISPHHSDLRLRVVHINMCIANDFYIVNIYRIW